MLPLGVDCMNWDKDTFELRPLTSVGHGPPCPTHSGLHSPDTPSPAIDDEADESPASGPDAILRPVTQTHVGMPVYAGDIHEASHGAEVPQEEAELAAGASGAIDRVGAWTRMIVWTVS